MLLRVASRLESATPDGLAAPDVYRAANDDGIRATCRVQCNEVGIGTGHNLRHYGREVTSVTGIDPAAELTVAATARARRTCW